MDRMESMGRMGRMGRVHRVDRMDRMERIVLRSYLLPWGHPGRAPYLVHTTTATYSTAQRPALPPRDR